MSEWRKLTPRSIFGEPHLQDWARALRSRMFSSSELLFELSDCFRLQIRSGEYRHHYRRHDIAQAKGRHISSRAIRSHGQNQQLDKSVHRAINAGTMQLPILAYELLILRRARKKRNATHGAPAESLTAMKISAKQMIAVGQKSVAPSHDQRQK